METENEKIKDQVREAYGLYAETQSSCCGPSASPADQVATSLDYDPVELKNIPDGANIGAGCGNPTAHASLKKGEIVVDLGSGAGIDCFLAANKVGDEGYVIGVDFTPQMLAKARENAVKGGYTNVEFRKGDIENLPIVNNSVNVIISNCVINLAPDKEKVFKEAFRVLKPGGRLMVSDIVLLKELPDVIAKSVEAYAGCVSGAIQKEEYLQKLKNASFSTIEITKEVKQPIYFEGSEIKDSLASINVSAYKA